MTTGDNEWQRVTMNDNEWQRVTMNDNDWYNEWKRMKVNENCYRFQNETITQCIATIYSATSFWNYNASAEAAITSVL